MSDEIKLDPNLGMTPHEKIKHDQELYRDAKIDRHESHGDAQRRANHALEDIGRFIQADSSESPILKGAEYMGSCAVHVYELKALRQAFFICQTDPMVGRVHEVVASDATVDLRKALMTAYGRKAHHKRSGF